MRGVVARMNWTKLSAAGCLACLTACGSEEPGAALATGGGAMITGISAQAPDSPSSSQSSTGGATSGLVAAYMRPSERDTGLDVGRPSPKDLEARSTLEGEATWVVSPDAASLAAGASACSFTRTYKGVEIHPGPWVCPECEVVYRAEATLVSGLSCYLQWFGRFPPSIELLGYGKGAWYRASHSPMFLQGTAQADTSSVRWNNQTQFETPFIATAEVNGTFVAGHELAWEDAPLVPPAKYACGWPKADPPAYTGDYSLAVGKQLPDGIFKDACGEAVRLHDLAGTYLLVEMAAVDCPACRTMSEYQQWWVDELASVGLKLRVVTLLAPSLAGRMDTAGTEVLKLWSSTFQLNDPVLGDRMWGLNVIGRAYPGSGYPSFVLASPTLEVIDVPAENGWFPVRAALEKYAGLQRIEAESLVERSPGLFTLRGGSGTKLGGVPASDAWAGYGELDFTGVTKVSARVTSQKNTGDIELRLDSATGPLVGTLHVPATGAWETYATVDTSLTGATGLHKLYLVWTRQTGPFGDIDYFLLSK